MTPVAELVAALDALWLRPTDSGADRAEKLGRRAGLARQLADALPGTGLAPATAVAAARLLRDVRAGGTEFVEVAQRLAEAAWKAGHPDGGRLYAETTDLLCNLRHQPQRYGTITYHQHGETVMPPVDPEVTDAERAALGLPSLAEVRAAIAAGNLRLAKEIAAGPGLPAGVELRRAWHDEDPAALTARRHAEGPVWRDGDDLVVVWQGEAESVSTADGIQLPMWEVPGSDLWVLRARVRDLDRAMVGVGFAVRAAGAAAVHRGGDLCWRGPLAPPPPPRSRPLAGALRRDSLPGPTAGGTRAVTAYLPPGHDPASTYPVVYLADGHLTADLAEVADAAVVAGAVPPVVLVGVAAGRSSTDDRRNDEYLVARRPDVFEAHRSFFVETVAAWAEAELGGSADRERRCVFGLSSGAAFAVTMGLRHSDRFGTVLALSLGIHPADPARWPAGGVPRHYLAAGTLEGGFRRSTANWASAVRAAGGECAHVEPVSGHDYRMWEAQFPLALAWALG